MVDGTRCRARFHSMARVLAMGRARRQRRWHGEDDAEPECPEGDEWTKPERPSHKYRIHSRPHKYSQTRSYGWAPGS